MTAPRIPSLLATALLLAFPPLLRAQSAPEQQGDTSMFRPLDLRTPNQYRTGGGQPGPAYWQQRADYRIRAALDTATKVITGTETIRYRNHSPNTLNFVWLQVDQNLYRPTSIGARINPPDSRWGARNFAGGDSIHSVRVGGKSVQPYIYDTMMRLDLPRPLAPGQSTEMEIAWSFMVPEHGSDRLAREGSLYEIAQWFPRMAVYDDVHGWNTDPYIGQGEFYREFGDYDVALTVPAGYVVAATGTLQNPGDVLSGTQRERLARGVRSTEQVAVITPAEADANAAHAAPGTRTWRFNARNVHDFAWAASPDFRWDATSWNGVACHALYGPNAPAWKTAADVTCFSIAEFSRRWFPYPWPQATSVAGPVGGMEYPMFVMVHNTSDEQGVFGTIAHEHGHEWFPMIVSSNERRYAWMDEGFNTFIDSWANGLRYPGVETRYSEPAYRRAYEGTAAAGAEQPIMTPPDRLDRAVLGTEAYRKPALALLLLRNQVVGPEAFDRAFQTYIQRWAYKHPTPADFFRTMNDVTGRDLDWFWREWFYTTDVLDQAVAGVQQQKQEDGTYRATITLARRTPMVMPVPLRLTLENGQTQNADLPVEIWFGGSTYPYVVDVPSPVTGVLIDPQNTMPDMNRTNNAWGTARAGQ